MGEKTDIPAAEIFKTEQLTPKQSRELKRTTGRRKNIDTLFVTYFAICQI